MTARTGMETMIETVRGYSVAGTNDWTIGSTTYFSDDEIQRVLDRHRKELRQWHLTDDPEYIGDGTIAYYRHNIGYANIESGTAFELEYSTGATVGTALWTLNGTIGRVDFGTNDTLGTSFMCNAYAYDLYAAAADIWRMKAAYYATNYDFSTDNHNFRRSSVPKQCNDQAAYFDRLADNSFTQDQGLLYRSDT